VVAAALAAGYFAYRSVTDTGEVVLPPERFFWTADDGKTRFAGPTDVPSPSKIDGKEAVLLHVYTCDDGKTDFVGFMEKFNDAYLEKAGPKPPTVKTTDPGAMMARMVKRPGGNWASITSLEGSTITSIRCPDGHGENINEVFPD
jgi:hypothetical protein